MRARGLKWFVFIRNWPIAIKLSVSFSLLFMAIVSIITLSSYTIYRDSMQQQINEYIPQILDKMNINFNNYVGQMISMSEMPFVPPYNTSIVQALRTIEETEVNYSLANTLSLHNALNFITIQPQYLNGVTVYTNFGYAYTRIVDGGGIWEKKSYKNESWYGEDDTITGMKIVGAVRRQGVLSNELVFTIVQPIKAFGSTKNLGYFEVTGSLNEIEQLAKNIDFGPNSNMFIVDHRNTILYATENKLRTGAKWNNEYGLNLDTTPDVQGSRMVGVDGHDYLLSFNQSQSTHWKIVTLVPIENLSKGIKKVRSLTFIWIMFGILTVCLLSVVIAFTITNPLRHLTRQMQFIEKNDFFIHLKSSRLDEVGQLALALRKMARRIKILIFEVYQYKLLKQEAEISALQSQINPHFMNNVLETIRMMNLTGKHEQVDKGLVLLGEITRYHTKQSNEMVTVESEMAFIHSYLNLQKLRFAEALEVMLDIDEKALPLHIPNLLIQPIIENAITHGQSPYDQTIRIILRIGADGDWLTIAVVDEGPGIPGEEIDRMHLQLEQGVSEKRKVGLLNVYQRIKLIYKEAGNMFIQSEEGLGTKIVIKIPIRR